MTFGTKRVDQRSNPSSAALEFNTFVDMMVGHCELAREIIPKQREIGAERVIPDFDLPRLENVFLNNFHTRNQAEFKKDPKFSDNWMIHKNHVKNGKWTKALTLAKANEGVVKGYFQGKVPSMVARQKQLGGVDVTSWDDLIAKYGDQKYLNTRRTLNDHADENKNIILGLKNVKLELNTGKVVRIVDKVLYVAHVLIEKEPYFIFTFVNKLKLPSWQSRVLETLKGYY
jgi:hypothetical protein